MSDYVFGNSLTLGQWIKWPTTTQANTLPAFKASCKKGQYAGQYVVNYYSSINANTSATNPGVMGMSGTDDKSMTYDEYRRSIPVPDGDFTLTPGARRVTLPDGATLVVDENGNYRIEDKDAKVTYKANHIREFNPYLNASDLLERFIRYVGTLGVRQSEVRGLPVELFIQWLVIEAAAQDQEPPPEGVVPVAAHPRLQAITHPRCRACAAFVPRAWADAGFAYCSLPHLVEGLARVPHRKRARTLRNKSRLALLVGRGETFVANRAAMAAGLFPDLSLQEKEFVLWELTSYPFYHPRHWLKQAIAVRRRLDEGVTLHGQAEQVMREMDVEMTARLCPQCGRAPTLRRGAESVRGRRLLRAHPVTVVGSVTYHDRHDGTPCPVPGCGCVTALAVAA